MVRKYVLCPERLRRVPRDFSWVDHRLVRERHISRCSHAALALYLFLVTVGDAEGLSYYSDGAAGRLLNMEADTLTSARKGLCRCGLIVYQRPIYQVLSLDDLTKDLTVLAGRRPRSNSCEAMSIGEVLRQAIGGAE